MSLRKIHVWPSAEGGYEFAFNRDKAWKIPSTELRKRFLTPDPQEKTFEVSVSRLHFYANNPRSSVTQQSLHALYHSSPVTNN